MVYTNGYMFPLLLAPVIVWVLVRRTNDPRDAPRQNVVLLVLLVLATFLVLVVQPWTYFRYMIGLLPVFAVLLALVVWEVWKRRRIAGLLILTLLVFTNLPSAALPPLGLRFDLIGYLSELTHDYDGPNEAIVEYLRQHGTQDDVVVASYGDLPIMFYTRMRVVGFSQDLGAVGRPDWIVPRHGRGTRDYLMQLGRNYRRIPLEAADIPWGNRPDPAYHKFRTVREGPQVVILRRPTR